MERLLLGNKCDMEAKRQVQREQAEKVSEAGLLAAGLGGPSEEEASLSASLLPLSSTLLPTSSPTVGSRAQNPIF